MTNNDELALNLKEAAEVATQGNWYVDHEFDVCSENYGFVGEVHGDNLVLNAKFIATANPANILALLAERDADKKRIAELTHNHRVHAARLLDERGQLKERIAELEAVTLNAWIKHDGKWRPESLSTDELVYLKTRKQEMKIPYPAGRVKGWMHTGGDMDVMAYKPADLEASKVSVKLPNKENEEAIAYGGSGAFKMGRVSGFNEAIDIMSERLTAADIKLEVGE